MAYFEEERALVPSFREQLSDPNLPREQADHLRAEIDRIESEAETIDYLLRTGTLLGRYLDPDTPTEERKSITISFLQAIGDYEGAQLVEAQWAVKKEVGAQWQTTLETQHVGEEHEMYQEEEDGARDYDSESDEEEDAGSERESQAPRRAPRSQPTPAFTQPGQCRACGSFEFIDDTKEGQSGCAECGLVNQSSVTASMTRGQIETSGASVTTKYSYSRSSHFRDRLMQWQGLEYKGDVSQEVMDRLLLQLKKEKITSVAGWTRRKMVRGHTLLVLRPLTFSRRRRC
jgi:hypothetical protein